MKQVTIYDIELPDSIDPDAFGTWVRKIAERLCAGDREYEAVHMTYSESHVVSNVIEELLDIPGWSYLMFDKLWQLGDGKPTGGE